MTLEAAQERHKSIGRNDPCTCGSGKKYKKCHQLEDDQLLNAELRRLVDVAKAEAAALAEAQEAEGKGAGASRSTPGKPSASGASAKRNGKGAGNANSTPRSSKGDKSQSLPRRGAV